MEAKIEVINGHNVIRTEHWSLTEDNNLLRTSAHFKLDDNDLDELYAVLHARHLAQHYDKTIMSRIEKAVNHGSYDFESDHEGSSALFKYTQTIPNEVFIPNNPVLERIAIALERIAIALETSKYVASKNNNPYEVTYNKEVKNE